MTILYKTLKELRIYLTQVDFYVTLVGNTLIGRFKYPDGSSASLSVMYNYLKISYNGETKEFSGSAGDVKVEFPYAEGIKSLTILCSAPAPAQKIYYDGVYYGNSFPVSWSGPAEEPVCVFAPVSIHEDYGNRLTWSFTSSVGNPCAAVELWYYEKNAEDSKYTGTKLISGKYSQTTYVHTIPAGEAGKLCYYRLGYCSYASADAENYLTYGETVTEVFTIGDTQKYPAAPPSITYNKPAAGGNVKVVWEKAEDSFNDISEYTLERRLGNGNWTLVYQGSSTSFMDKLSANLSAETVTYRVRSVDTEGDVSDWLYGETLAVIKSNLYVMYNGEVRPAAQVYVGGVGAVGAMAYVG